MKSTGIVRKVDRLGRIVLPKELRNVLDIYEGTSLEIYVDEEKNILKKYVESEPPLEVMTALKELKQLQSTLGNTDHKDVLSKAIKLIGGK
ncbi:AbrB/MazE/SpoVT family DNA-binding domain-containing protein [Kurthia sp. YJT4]|uniref:AbrB/MazE/SpoVT family DNA-binding domain-containing protein n=1 Tax=Kurthia sp. YJT4 TaxID=3049086 RepID=UPI00254D5BC7|nr:AbrB/MazE/SpoVT family DNA-binding domain-containing protein [Kurthia sp. YJT4]WIL37570.1 AbrB/MazE/SpoVT family DNA-binding domain-containing protein [Kurthia sp. YJT4]